MILNVGLKGNCPLIEVVPLPVTDQMRKAVEEADTIICTSQTTVRFLKEGGFSLFKRWICIGEATAKEVRGEVVPFPTQEGMILFLDGVQGRFVYPRSSKARPLLGAYIEKRGGAVFDLYDTVTRIPYSLPNLADFEAVEFTSPSTVDAFLHVFGKWPPFLKWRAIGPITEEHCRKFLGRDTIEIISRRVL
jgi:uroporphyrinogen-III synthase